MKKIMLPAVLLCLVAMQGTVEAAYYETTAVYDVWGDETREQFGSQTPSSTVVSVGGTKYAEVHHTANQVAAASYVDGLASGNARYTFSLYNTSDPGAEGYAMIGFSGSAWASANNGYVRTLFSVYGSDQAIPDSSEPQFRSLFLGPQWSGSGVDSQGYFIGDSDLEIGEDYLSFDSDDKGTGVLSASYSGDIRLRFNSTYTIRLSVITSVMNGVAGDFAMGWIDPSIILPGGVGLTIEPLENNPDFPTIIAPSSEYPNGAFVGNPVPLPGAVWLFGTGLIGLLGFRSRRQ